MHLKTWLIACSSATGRKKTRQAIQAGKLLLIQVKEAGTDVLASDTLVDPQPEPEPEPGPEPEAPDHVGGRDASGRLGSGELIV